MKKVLIGLALVVAIATAFAVPAFSTPSSSVPVRVKTLEAKVKALTTRLNRTQALATVSAAKLSCLKSLMPVSSYGDGTSSGYVYTKDARATTFLTSALDVTEQGQTPGRGWRWSSHPASAAHRARCNCAPTAASVRRCGASRPRSQHTKLVQRSHTQRAGPRRPSSVHPRFAPAPRAIRAPRSALSLRQQTLRPAGSARVAL